MDQSGDQPRTTYNVIGGEPASNGITSAKVVEGVLVSAPGVLIALVAVLLTHYFTARRESRARYATLVKERGQAVVAALEKAAAAFVGMPNDLSAAMSDRLRNGSDASPTTDVNYDAASALVAIYFRDTLGDEWDKFSAAYLNAKSTLGDIDHRIAERRLKTQGLLVISTPGLPPDLSYLADLMPEWERKRQLVDVAFIAVMTKVKAAFDDIAKESERAAVNTR